MKKFAFVSDFDGTLSDKDFYHIVIDKYMGQVGRDFYHNWKKTKKINVEFLNLIFSNMGKSEEETRAEILNIPLDKYALNFIKKVQKAGGDFYVLSAGTSYYIKILLESLGIDDVSIISMEGMYKDGSIVITPDKDSPYYSEVFGVDKGKIIKELKEKYENVYFAGDSEPDISAAINADLAFAKGELQNLLKNEKCDYMQIDTYNDIDKYFSEKGLLNETT